jgi:hypothetical protein
VANSLIVDRLLNIYLVPQDHPAPEQVRRDLDEVARKYVADAWGQALSAVLDPRDPSIWLIDKVNTDVLMDINAAPPDGVAAFWAAKMADSVAKTIARGEDGSRIMRFADRAAYLAYFLRDLAAGTAWSKWYYREFEALRSLPSGPAIREAMTREPEMAEPALLHLVKTDLISEVTNVLSESDQERLLHLCSAKEAAPGQKCFRAVLEEWAAAPNRSRRALDLYLKARHAHPEFPSAEVRGGVERILTIARWADTMQLNDILAAAGAHRLSEILLRLPPQEQETALYLASLASDDPTLRGRIEQIIFSAGENGRALERPPRSRKQNTSRFASPWGSVFLLLPTLIADRQLMAAYGGHEDGALRCLLFAACLRANFTDSRHDQALLTAAGLAETPELLLLQQARPKTNVDIGQLDLLPDDFEHINAAGKDWWPDIALAAPGRHELTMAAAAVIRNFARQLPGLGKSSFEYLWRNVFSGGSVITLVPGLVLVELGPPPLQIVLRMAGLDGVCFNPPWLVETEVVVRVGQQ